MEPLTDILDLLHPGAVFSKPITGRGRWGIQYGTHPSPSFCLVQKGRCWLVLKAEQPLLLEPGDFLLLPQTPAFTLVTDPGVICRAGRPSRSAVRHGDPKGPADFRMIGGTFEVQAVNDKLWELFPRVHVRAATCNTTRIARVVELIVDEYTSDRPGREFILRRLLETMLAEALRLPDREYDPLPPGLAAGLHDPQVARALQSLHADIKKGWTVAELAKLTGMSRSAFASRFRATVGCSPIEYRSRWRMSVAQKALIAGCSSLERLAEEIGYQSASAFNTAFSRRVGCSPGAFARANRADPDPRKTGKMV
jgi:AraC-like DNA-binding protein